MSASIEERVARLISEYDAQGWHRTGTSVDALSAEWLAEAVAGCGLEPRLEPVALDRVEVIECWVEADRRRVEGVPLFDGGSTDAEGVVGSLGACGSGAAVGLISVGPRGAGEELLAARRAGTEEAIVTITTGGRPGLALRNAPAFCAPFGPPVVQVSSTESDWLHQVAANGRAVRVVARVERVPSEAHNVVASLAGDGTQSSRLAVNTPRSGWWEVAAERGGGLACWLEVMRDLASHGSKRDVLFSATTGHELGYYGFDALLAARPSLAAEVTWIHFGASIGSATPGPGSVSASDDAVAEVAVSAIERAGARPVRATVGEPTGGEMVAARRHGARRWVALTNENDSFHMREDRFPANVDVPAVAAYARAFIEVARLIP